MATIHTAYLFNPTRFHEYLEQTIVVQDSLRHEKLLDIAKAGYNNSQKNSKELLSCLRFDPEWFDDKDKEISHTTQWYLLALTQHLVQAPSLSNRFSVSYFVLQRALLEMGWTKAEIDRPLIYGNPLHTLVGSSENKLFIDEFTAIDQFGGWISVHDAKETLYKIEAQQREFLTPSDKVIAAITDLSARWSQSPKEILSKAYNDAVDMLSAPINQNQALFICVNL